MITTLDTLTEQLLDWIPRNTKNLKIPALELVGVKRIEYVASNNKTKQLMFKFYLADDNHQDSNIFSFSIEKSI